VILGRRGNAPAFGNWGGVMARKFAAGLGLFLRRGTQRTGKSHVFEVGSLLRRTFNWALLIGLGVFAGASQAAVISAGPPTTTVPAALSDPIATLSSPLPANEFLLPIKITGANVLQDWSFDVTFNGGVVTPLDLSGLFQSVYQTEFNAVNTALSDITSSGFPGVGVLAGIAGFSFGASGDGLLAFVLFEFLPGHSPTEDPGIGIGNVTLNEQAPAPGTLVLLIPALAALGLRRRKTA